MHDFGKFWAMKIQSELPGWPPFFQANLENSGYLVALRLLEVASKSFFGASNLFKHIFYMSIIQLVSGISDWVVKCNNHWKDPQPLSALAQTTYGASKDFLHTRGQVLNPSAMVCPYTRLAWLIISYKILKDHKI